MQNLPRKIPPALANDRNRRVLAKIVETSVHSDLSDLLQSAVKPLEEVQLYCPDLPKHHYVVASTRHVIFGFAIARSTLAFRLDQRLRQRALASGGAAFPACGRDWVTFKPFRDGQPSTDFRFWALKAYDYAREIGD
jgi:hypothetical protein